MTAVNAVLAQHDLFGAIEEEFNEVLAESLQPRGPEMLYDLISELSLPLGATALDVGSGEGAHTVELAERFGLATVGVEPLQRHIEIAQAALRARGGVTPPGNATFRTGSAGSLPAEAASIDLVWCRDVLCMVEDLGEAYREFRRVLKPGGRALVYQAFSTELLDPREAAWLLPTMGCVTENMTPDFHEQAIRRAGLTIDRCLVLGTEWGEFGQEQSGKGARKLLQTARLLRDPQRYIARFGQANYDIALGDGLWHVYRLIGKLSDRVYVLSAPE